jgi:prepilin signal peptidase PulO-like enzyme (type II secretory pathway)
MIFLILFIFWTAFGSFSTVLIERWKSWTPGILFGRSECPKCHTVLSTSSLIPILSYLFQRGKCKKCHTHISFFYPLAEATMGVIFIIVWYFILFNGWEILEIRSIILFILWFITGLYALYDARYMEVPDKALVPGIYSYLLLIFISIFLGYDTLIFDRESYLTYQGFLYDHLLWALVVYSFFYLQILIPGGFYLLRKRDYKWFFELLFSYITFPLTLIGELRRDDKEEPWTEESIPTWVWWWDLRIALFIGITLGTVHSLFALFVAYISGSIIGLLILAYKKKRSSKKHNSQIPFWPFLAFWWCMAILWYGEVLGFIMR